MSLAAIKRSASAEQPGADFVLPMPEGGPWTRDKAFAFAIEMAKQEPENDTIAYWFLPHAYRPAIATIYSFARFTYDYAALPANEPVREAAITACENALVQAFRGHAEHPVFVAVREIAEQFDLPITPFQDFLMGCRMTMRMRRFSNFSQLQQYTDKVANPLGRLVLMVAGDRSPDRVRAADDVSTALQLSSFWAHVSRDFQRGRIHLPEEDMLRFGVTESDLKQRRNSKEFKALMDYEITRTRLLLKRGRPVFKELPKALHMQLQMVWLGVTVALDNIEADNFDVFTRDHSLRTQDWVRAAGRLASWRLRDFTQW